MKKTFELTSQHIVPVSYQHLCSFILKHGPDSFCKVVNGISVKYRFHRVNIIKHIDFLVSKINAFINLVIPSYLSLLKIYNKKSFN